MSESYEPRLRELELRFTEQQDLLQELSQVMFQQQRAIDSLSSEVRMLRKRLEAEPGLVDAKRDDPPPHY
jgi:SlyX protein